MSAPREVDPLSELTDATHLLNTARGAASGLRFEASRRETIAYLTYLAAVLQVALAAIDDPDKPATGTGPWENVARSAIRLADEIEEIAPEIFEAAQ